MADAPAAPQQSASEKALQEAQTSLISQQQQILTDQVKQQNALMPILYKEAGLTPTFDSSGNITGFTQDADPQEVLRKEVETSLLQRTKDALAGNLPVDPGLERDLARQGSDLKASLASQLGTGWETSSPGLFAEGQFGESANALRYASRRDQLVTAGGLAQNQAGINSNTLGAKMGFQSGVSSLRSPGLQLGAQLAGTAGAGAANMAQSRMQQYQIQSQYAAANSPLALLGPLLGAGAKAAFAPYGGSTLQSIIG